MTGQQYHNEMEMLATHIMFQRHIGLRGFVVNAHKQFNRRCSQDNNCLRSTEETLGDDGFTTDYIERTEHTMCYDNDVLEKPGDNDGIQEYIANSRCTSIPISRSPVYISPSFSVTGLYTAYSEAKTMNTKMENM